jgi:hypothetical protein
MKRDTAAFEVLEQCLHGVIGWGFPEKVAWLRPGSTGPIFKAAAIPHQWSDPGGAEFVKGGFDGEEANDQR